MAQLSKRDKKDLVAQVKGQFFQQPKRKKLTLDEFIEFLTVTNAFAGHKRRPFCPMTGDKFKL